MGPPVQNIIEVWTQNFISEDLKNFDRSEVILATLYIGKAIQFLDGKNLNMYQLRLKIKEFC